jgi:hypothetical protein
MKQTLVSMVVAGLLLWGGVELGQNSPEGVLNMLGNKLGITLPGMTATATSDSAADDADADSAADENKDLIPLESLNLTATDPPDTAYILSINASLNQSGLAADLKKLNDALYKSTILETVDNHGSKWFVLTVGPYVSREEAQRAAAVLYGSTGLTGVTRKQPPPPGAAP